VCGLTVFFVVTYPLPLIVVIVAFVYLLLSLWYSSVDFLNLSIIVDLSLSPRNHEVSGLAFSSQRIEIRSVKQISTQHFKHVVVFDKKFV
jgi:hypothetical protein